MDRFVIDDDSKANWAFKKLGDNKKKQDKLKKQLKMYNHQNLVWFQKQITPLIDEQTYFQSLIEEFRLTKPDGKVNTPMGKTMVRHTKQFDHDDNKILPFVEKNHPELVKKETNWAELKKTLQVKDGKAFDKNGEEVPGVEVSTRESISYLPTKEE